MKNARKVIGIISIVLFLIISFQSCAAGAYNTLADTGEVSGSAGLVLACCMAIAGIIGITCKDSNGATITSAILYAFGGFIGLINQGAFKDLTIWSVLSVIFCIVYLFTYGFQKDDSE